MLVFRRACSLLFLGFICAVAGLLLWHHHHSWEYGLPIKVGESSADVQRVLGTFTQTVDYDKEFFKEPEGSMRTVGHEGEIANVYYTSGIIGSFKGDRLISILVVPDNGDSPKRFLAYTGVIVRGLRIKDNKETILRTLGKPAKIESDSLPAGTDPDVPALWPKESSYYWRLPDCVLTVGFLNQAQTVSDEITLPRDSVIGFEITK